MSKEMFVTIEHNGIRGYSIYHSHKEPRHKLPKIRGSRGWVEVDETHGKSKTFIGGTASRRLRFALATQVGTILAQPGDTCRVVLHLGNDNSIIKVER